MEKKPILVAISEKLQFELLQSHDPSELRALADALESLMIAVNIQRKWTVRGGMDVVIDVNKTIEGKELMLHVNRVVPGSITLES